MCVKTNFLYLIACILQSRDFYSIVNQGLLKYGWAHFTFLLFIGAFFHRTQDTECGANRALVSPGEAVPGLLCHEEWWPKLVKHGTSFALFVIHEEAVTCHVHPLYSWKSYKDGMDMKELFLLYFHRRTRNSSLTSKSNRLHLPVFQNTGASQKIRILWKKSFFFVK